MGRASVYTVDLAQGHNDPLIAFVLDEHLGAGQEIVTFDGISPAWLTHIGQTDTRFLAQGVLLELISPSVLVGGSTDSGPIVGGGLMVSPSFSHSRVRVRFVEPGTLNPTTVAAMGVWTTTPDIDKNCLEFFDVAVTSLGVVCAQAEVWYPTTDVEFIGGKYTGGISFVDIFSPRIPFEVDLLSFSLPPLEVDIDIKPWSDPNAINPNSKGKIPVAILTTSIADGDRSDFDASVVNPLSLEFGPSDAEIVHSSGHLQDADGDGDVDLVVHFKTRDTGITCGDTEAALTGQTFVGQPISGSDAIKTPACGRPALSTTLVSGSGPSDPLRDRARRRHQ